MPTWYHPGQHASLRYTTVTEQCSRAVVPGLAAAGALSSLALVLGPAAALVLPVLTLRPAQAVADVEDIVPVVQVRPVNLVCPETPAMEAALAQEVSFPVAIQVLKSERDGKSLLTYAHMILTCPTCPTPVPMAENCGAAAPFVPFATPIYAAKALRCSSLAISRASWAHGPYAMLVLWVSRALMASKVRKKVVASARGWAKKKAEEGTGPVNGEVTE
jgi:hypothetical protein